MARTFSSGNYLSVASPAPPAIPWTVAGWAYSTDGTASNQTPWWAGQPADNVHEFRMTFTTGGKLRFIGFTFTAESTTSFSANTWHHCMGVVASTTSRTVYLDNAGAATSTDGFNPTLTHTYLGVMGRSTPILPWVGRLAEWAVWNVALDADSRKALAQGKSPLLVRPENLVFYCPIIGRSSPEPDYIGGLQLALTGTVAKADHPRIIQPRRQPLIFVSAGGAPPSDFTPPQGLHTIEHGMIGHGLHTIEQGIAT